MTIEQRLYQLLSPVIDQLFPVSPPVGTEPPYTVYQRVAQDPITTQEGTATTLKRHHLQFCSYGIPGTQYAAIDDRTQTIMDTLLPFTDIGIQSITLQNRHTHLDTHYKLDASVVEFEIWESL